ncbi:MAG: peptidylprolyl isomerase [Bacteroidota bacterium]
MRTELGDVYIKLYDETPVHKKNFLKLAKSGFFDGQAFHRIVNHLVIQAGDPRTKNAYPPTNRDKPYDAGYKLPAEIIDTMAHTYGKLGMARKDTSLNPKRKSSSSQFYIVTGRRMTVAGLDSIEENRSGVLQSQLYQSYKSQLDSGWTSLNFVQYMDSVGFEDYKYPAHQEKAYYTKGGVPSLDNEYTIFGEVLKGMNIVDQIEILPTNKYDMPNQPFRILEMKVLSSEEQ